MNETQVVRNFYAALNGNDIAAAVRDCDPDFEWVEPAEYPGVGTYRGLENVTAHFQWARGRWAEGSCELERLIVAGDRVVALVAVRVRLKDEAEWRVGDIGDVFTFRDGKLIHGRTFGTRQEALEWAGVGAVSPEAAR